MTSLDDMRRELREKYEKLKTGPWVKASSNPGVTPTQLVEEIVELMDWATLWRWKTAIDKRLEKEREREKLRREGK
ncbi:hypothetical protein ES703_46326 [subsurface metagenome]